MSRYPMRRKKRQVFNPHEISFNIFEGGRPGMVLNFLSVDKNAYSPLVDRIPACTGREVCIPGALGRGVSARGVSLAGKGGVCPGEVSDWGEGVWQTPPGPEADTPPPSRGQSIIHFFLTVKYV